MKTLVKPATIALAFLLIGGLLLVTTANSSAQASTTGSIGIGNLTARIIAYPGEIISGQVNATGFTFGVYIGPGVTGVLIYHAHIFGADDHGIVAVDTSGISVMYSNISYDVLHPVPSILDHKAVGFYGVSNSYIIGNTITHNVGDGGIAVYSSSSLVPTGLPIPNANSSGDNNFIADNYVANDASGCGIVVAAWGPGMSVSNNWIFRNTVIGSILTPHGPTGFNVGTIVVAADFPFSRAVDSKREARSVHLSAYYLSWISYYPRSEISYSYRSCGRCLSGAVCSINKQKTSNQKERKSNSCRLN